MAIGDLTLSGSDWTLQVPQILATEGGKNSSTSDLAMQNPVNAAAYARLGFHTNRGWTYATFATAAPYLAQQGLIPDTSQASVDAAFSAMTDQVWGAAYYALFWQPLYCDYLPQWIADVLVRWAWGSGPYYPVYHLQSILVSQYGANIATDGQMGPETVDAVNGVQDQLGLLNAFAQAWTDYINAVVANNPSQAIWYQGWMSTVNSITDSAKKS